MSVYGFGRGEDGQLGQGDISHQHLPVHIDLLSERIAQVACGSGHSAALTDEGEVFTWGRGDDGRLGHGDKSWRLVPRLVAQLQGNTIREIACGSYDTAAITVSGELFTWGGGMYGKLGIGNEEGQSSPRLVETLKDLPVKQVACGSRFTLVLLENSDVYGWGDTLGTDEESSEDQFLPSPVQELHGKDIVQISACGFHSAALSESGEVFTFGAGEFGRLGHGSELDERVPRVVEALKGKHVKQVACGGFHTAAVLDTGEVYTWGGGEHGQLGHGDKVNTVIPARVESLADKVVVQITCGWSHTIALTDTGDVYAWGNGDHGKLGDNDTNKVALPKLVDGLEGKRVTSVASYNEHTLVLVDDKK